MKRFTALLAFALLVAGVAAGAAFSPLFLRHSFKSITDSQLQRAANIATTYGVASAILSALSLILVAISLIYQARQARESRLQALRSLHIDLLKLSLEDRTLLETWGPFSSGAGFDEQRQHIYVNMIVQHWRLMHDVGSLSSPQLAVMAAELMQSTAAQRYWQDSLQARTQSGAKVNDKFHEVLDAEYSRATRI